MLHSWCLKKTKTLIWRYLSLHRRGEGGAGRCDSFWSENKFLKRQVFLSLISLVHLLPHWVNNCSWWWFGKSQRSRTGAHCPFAGDSPAPAVQCSLAGWGSAPICLGTQWVDETASYGKELSLGSEIFLLLLSLPVSFCEFESSVKVVPGDNLVLCCSGGEQHLTSFLGIFSSFLSSN